MTYFAIQGADVPKICCQTVVILRCLEDKYTCILIYLDIDIRIKKQR